MANTTLNYPSLANVTHDLTFFMKLQQNQRLTLADLTKIAQGRWNYFQLNWDFVKSTYFTRINSLPDGNQKVSAKAAFIAFDALIFDNRSSLQNPLNNPANLRKFHDLFDQIFIDDIQPTVAEQTIIADEVKRITNLKKSDFFSMRERVRITHDKLTDSLGMGDDTYNELYHRVAGPQILTFKFADFQVLSSLIQLKNTITSLIPTTFVENENPDPFLLIRRALNNSAIPMDTFQTGFMVPFPAGGSLERLAAQYLGDPDSWMEIAVANGLQFPYVDELGTQVSLLINGVGNSVIVPLEQYQNIAVNDEVFVGSNGAPLTQRIVQSLEQIPANNQLVVTLSGAADLDRYLTTQGAFLFYYARNTLNSGRFVMIPTKGTVTLKPNSQTPWFVNSLPSDLKGMGVDLALGSDDDLVFNTTGDLQLSYGLANAAQAVNLKVKIKTSELIRNPTFGLRELVGRLTNAEITQHLLILIVESALSGDDRFDGLSGFGYTLTGNAIFINASIKIAGSTSSVPLTFQIPKGS